MTDDGDVCPTCGQPVKPVRVTETVDSAGEAATEGMWNSDAHPRAGAGSAAGGEFAAGGGGSSSSKRSPGHRSVSAHKGAATRKNGALAYDAAHNTGAGYSSKNGDPRVHALQQALNRLGVTDAHGHRLADDGKLGPLTTQAVKAAQRRLGVAQDGKVTPALLAKLKAAAAPQSKRAKASEEPDMDDRTTEMVRDGFDGRILEAKGVDEAGGRVFRVGIIAAGDSQNRRRYPSAVLTEAAPLYEGAKAYDHHRTDEELRTGTIAGLVGYYRNVEAAPLTGGLDADLHLLPSASQTAEALDQSLANQADGLPPLVGISHDVLCNFKPITVGGRRMQEAVSISRVHSADVVSDPAAGGKAVRALAGGIDPEEDDPAGTEPDGHSTEESDVTVTTESVLEALKTATPEQLGAVGLQRASEATPPEPVEEKVTEAAAPSYAKTSPMARMLLKAAVEDAGLPAAVTESISAALPDRVTETDIESQIATIKSSWALLERGGLAPTATAQVTQESIDKKRAALDAFFDQDFRKGYHSFREAYIDFTGHRTARLGEDLNRQVMRESIGAYDSAGRVEDGERTTESMTASTWNLVLGDSITRRLISAYQIPNLSTWRQVVSSIMPINDFRTQRIDRLGGYGLLPTVSEGAPYQPLTSPTNEEVTYAIAKRGGTEDLTLEMIANDDVRAISGIPRNLGITAANTIYQYVWNLIVTNASIYDSTALFTTGHANYVNSGSGSALSQSALTAARVLMTSQTAYGDSTRFIAPTPRYLVYVNDLEEIAYQLVTSAVAIPATPAGPSNTPNIHQGLVPIRLDYPSSTTAWWTIGDPNMIPTIEVGFYQGREDPDLFVQNDQQTGSMFQADKVTYKMRHIYNAAVLDFRGMAKGN